MCVMYTHTYILIQLALVQSLARGINASVTENLAHYESLTVVRSNCSLLLFCRATLGYESFYLLLLLVLKDEEVSVLLISYYKLIWTKVKIGLSCLSVQFSLFFGLVGLNKLKWAKIRNFL